MELILKKTQKVKGQIHKLIINIRYACYINKVFRLIESFGQTKLKKIKCFRLDFCINFDILKFLVQVFKTDSYLECGAGLL